jgi:hypothetical protein
VNSAAGTGVYVGSAGENGVLAATRTESSYGGYFVNGASPSATSGVGAGIYAAANADGHADVKLGGEGWISSDGSINLQVDENNNDDNARLNVQNSEGAELFNIYESGAAFVLNDLYVQNNLYVLGLLAKGGGSFKIDHPLDPENKYLYHSFVESPDMMNIYNGNTLLDATGVAWIEMPAWFEALNMEFRYQLTPLGAPGPNLYIAQEIQNNRFQIAGGAPGAKVSWQVTGIRHDAFANANRIPVEVLKAPGEQGKYLYPAAWGQPQSKGITPAELPGNLVDEEAAARTHEAQQLADAEARRSTGLSAGGGQ